ncbi:MAG TPA: ChaN family lipoprotein [Ramlibacter sp.]|nr:ChaN family lipoprotein [Ramlibacter sp.]
MRRAWAVGLLFVLGSFLHRMALAELTVVERGLPETDVLLIGEQHDAPSHQRFHREVIEDLAAQGRLAAVAIEMAEQGASTATLPRDASESAVQAALRWQDTAWPWQAYGPALMAAVRAGVPVIGANLPRSQLRTAMANASLDSLLPGPALKTQQRAIRTGHCDLLPESQIVPMTRVQIARDLAMASVLARHHVAGKTVLLLAGEGHVDSAIGVPQHLHPKLRVRAIAPLPEPPQKDYCEDMRRQLKPAPAGATITPS